MDLTGFPEALDRVTDSIVDQLYSDTMLWESVARNELPPSRMASLAKPARLIPCLEECLPEVDMVHTSTPAVYFLVRGDRVVYVGESQDVLVRLLQHCGRISGGIPSHPFERAFFLPASEDVRERRALESHFIRLLRPSLNRQGRPLTPVFQSRVTQQFRESAAEALLYLRGVRDRVRRCLVQI